VFSIEGTKIVQDEVSNDGLPDPVRGSRGVIIALTGFSQFIRDGHAAIQCTRDRRNELLTDNDLWD